MSKAQSFGHPDPLQDSRRALTILTSGGANMPLPDNVAYTSTPNYFNFRQFFGTNSPSGDYNVLSINYPWSGSTPGLFAHAVRDESTFTSTYDGDAYASFDAIPEMYGATHFNHLNCFQARPYYHGDTLLDAVWGHTFRLNHTGSGTITNAFGLYVLDAQGSGTITLQAAIYIDGGGLTRGAANYVIYSGNTNTPSYHAGNFQTGADIIAAGLVTGSNLIFSAARNSMAVGTGVPSVSTLGYYTTIAGYNAGHAHTDAQLGNTNIGVAAGYSDNAGSYNTRIGAYAGYYATGSGCVMLGHKAGWSETGNNKLYIANSDTSTPLIYGDFSSAAVTINGALTATGLFTSLNVKFYDLLNSQAIGTGTPIISALGYYMVALGYNAAHSQTSSQLLNTDIGASAGYTDNAGSYNTRIGAYAGYYATGSGCVMLGHKAGYYETGNNKLYIANDETQFPLIGGDFSAGTVWLHGAKTSTSTVQEVLRITAYVSTASTGSVSGFGPALTLYGETATDGTAQQMGQIGVEWVVATNASRQARLALSVNDSVALREGLRIEANNTTSLLAFHGGTAVARAAALTTQLTTLTFTEPSTPDYAIQDFTQTSPWGFASHDEANTMLKVIANLQTRVAELEAGLNSATGVNLFG